MEVFVLMGGWQYEGDLLLGVYASEEEAFNAEAVYNRERDQGFDVYYIQRRVIGAPAVAEAQIDGTYL